MSYCYTVTETARLLNVDPETIAIYQQQGLKWFAIAGGELKFTLEDIQQFTKERKVK